MDPDVRRETHRLLNELQMPHPQQLAVWNTLSGQSAEEHRTYLDRLIRCQVILYAERASYLWEKFCEAHRDMTDLYDRRYDTRTWRTDLEASKRLRGTFLKLAQKSIARLVGCLETDRGALREEDVAQQCCAWIVNVVRGRLTYRRAYLMRRLRAHVKRRAIALFWQRVTVEALYAPEGAGRKRDRAEFEAWWGASA